MGPARPELGIETHPIVLEIQHPDLEIENGIVLITLKADGAGFAGFQKNRRPVALPVGADEFIIQSHGLWRSLLSEHSGTTENTDCKKRHEAERIERQMVAASDRKTGVFRCRLRWRITDKSIAVFAARLDAHMLGPGLTQAATKLTDGGCQGRIGHHPPGPGGFKQRFAGTEFTRVVPQVTENPHGAGVDSDVAAGAPEFTGAIAYLQVADSGLRGVHLSGPGSRRYRAATAPGRAS